MKFGVYYSYWQQEWAADFVPYCAKVAELGFDNLEIGAHILSELPKEKLTAIKNAARAAGVSLTACTSLPKHLDIASDDAKARAAGIVSLKKMLDALEVTGISLVGGIIYGCWPYDYSLPFDKKTSWGRSVEGVREVAAYAEARGISLMMETVNRFEHYLINTAEEAVAFVRDIGMDNVKILLDAFHMNIEEDFLGDAIRAAGRYLGHFHIGECNRKVPGKGHMPWKEIGQALRDIDYNGMVVMEPFVRTGGIVGSDIKVWRDLSANADDACLDADIAQALKFVKGVFLG
jgi:D-psicose/D-tagatose/L-ribulose 3-epimerase